MPILDPLERNLLFRLTRFLAFIVIFALTLGLAVGVFLFAGDLFPRDSSKITYRSIYIDLHSQTAESAAKPDTPEGDTSEPELTLPARLQPYFSTTQNKEVLDRHLAGLNSAARKDYLANLDDVVAEAKARNEDSPAVINKYFELKDVKVELAKANQTSRTLTQAYIIGAMISTLFLIALCSLILVLLAIERNTRKPMSAAAS